MFAHDGTRAIEQTATTMTQRRFVTGFALEKPDRVPDATK